MLRQNKDNHGYESTFDSTMSNYMYVNIHLYALMFIHMHLYSLFIYLYVMFQGKTSTPFFSGKTPEFPGKHWDCNYQEVTVKIT